MASQKAAASKAIEPDDDDLPRAESLRRSRQKPGDDAPPSGLAGDDGGTRGLMLAGSHPAAVILNGIKTIEQQITAISTQIPAFAAIAAPVLDQWKAVIAAGLSDLASGGLGTGGAGNIAPTGPTGGAGGAMPMPAGGPSMGGPLPPAPPPMM